MDTFTNEQIREKINQNNSIMQSLFDPTQFTLNERVRELQLENFALQEQCHHEYVDGVCIHCDRLEDR